MCASLAAHAALVGGAAEWYARETGTSIYLPGHPPEAVGGDVIVVTPEPDGPDRRTADFGEADSEGYAANSSPGTAVTPGASSVVTFGDVGVSVVACSASSSGGIIPVILSLLRRKG